MVVAVVPYIMDDLHRVEALARFKGRTDILTTRACRAGPAVDQLPPGVLLVGADSESIDVQVIQRNRLTALINGKWMHLGLWPGIEEEDIR